MSSTPTPTEPWTVRHWRELPRDGRRYEVLDGALLASPAASPLRQEVVHLLVDLLTAAIPAGVRIRRQVGICIGASVLTPDVLVTTADHQEPVVAAESVLLAAEVADGANDTTARTTTPALLARAGVPAYWRVEPAAGPAVVLHRLAGDAYTVEGRIRDVQTQTVTAPFQVTVTPRRLVPAT